MTYHRATDPVITPAGRAVFWQYWPDRTMGKVRMEDGRFSSFAVDQIRTPPVEVSRVVQRCVDAVAAAFRDLDEPEFDEPEDRDDWCSECERNTDEQGHGPACELETEAESASDRRNDR